MEAFRYVGNELFAEGVAVRALAERHGTPLYIYSRNHLRGQYIALAKAMAGVKPLICYSMKANSNLDIIRTLAAEGAGVDIVSGGELFGALRAGVDPSKIVFAGVGKTTDEICYALRERILFFTVESEPELARISECARRLRTTGRVAFRVNPDVNPRTHKHISTGKKENKFGLDLERAGRAYAEAARLQNIEVVGMHMHVGSQILSTRPFTDALRKVCDLCTALRARHPSFRYMDIGGGIGIRYKPDQEPLSPADFAHAVLPFLKNLGLSVVLEPGRFIVGNAGLLVCCVQYVKSNAFKKFVVVDAAMNDLIRPVLYEAHHEIIPCRRTRGTVQADLVGPICESGDFIAMDRRLPKVAEGDLLGVRSAGAYGFAMASNYNSRPRAAEIMVDGKKAMLVRRRETLQDLIRTQETTE
ncbi:MAG: diaminopimelate decarboxylase [bacterium]